MVASVIKQEVKAGLHAKGKRKKKKINKKPMHKDR